VQDVFTYRAPAGLEVQVGDIVLVPFGSQQLGGIVIRSLTGCPAELDLQQIRSIESGISSRFFLPSYWTVLQRVASYYHAPLMQVVRAALPPGLLSRSQRRIKLLHPPTPEQAAQLSPPAQQLVGLLQHSKTGDYAWPYIQRHIPKAARALPVLLRLGLVQSYLEPPPAMRPKQQQAVSLLSAQAEALTDRQQQVLAALQRRGGQMWVTELLQLCRCSSSTLKALVAKGYLAIERREVLRSEHHAVAPDQPKALTPDQEQVLRRIRACRGADQLLLHGVTGSGKTEVYLQAIAPLLDRNRSALVLVPEIGLTPQLTDRFRARFGDRVCVYHSALSDGERYDTWRQMIGDRAQVVIGTRSAIFAPLANLGLIILDEEHDSSFKQDQPPPCYHARTVAQWRSQLEDCPLLLGSATPSLETWVGAQTPEGVEYLVLPKRVYDRPLPQIQVVDMRQELQHGNRSIFSRPLQAALRDLRAKGQQGILFIHRRGYSTHVSCRSCGYVMPCPHCDVSLAYHQPHAEAQPLLRCHYCNYHQLQPRHCPDCDSPYFRYFGSGTQRVTQELEQYFPDLRVIRFDSDTTRTKGAHRTLLTQFARAEADLLVGTQMLTKGIDLPQVTLVAIVSADGILHLQDFRASERAFQTLLQVAGRAGRGEDSGQVLLQTYTPEHPVIQSVVQQDYAAFARQELALRQELHYPPYGGLILLRLSGPDAGAVQRSADQVIQGLPSQFGVQPEDQAQSLDSASPVSDYEVLGPAPAAIARVAQRYRWQILLKCADPASLPHLDLDALRRLCVDGVSLTIDVDPVTIL
jgi:primosomal protein N' (replication factor Y)